MKKAFLAFSRAGMEAYFQALTDKPYVIDKSRGWGVHFDLLQMIFGEEPKIICMVRDLRQILASLEKKFRQNPDKYRPIENHANLTGTTTFKRVLLSLQSPPVGLALDRLIEVHQRGWARKILFVRFEDLTTQPAADKPAPSPSKAEPVFETIKRGPLAPGADADTPEVFNELGVRRYDLPALWNRIRNHFRGPTTSNPRLVNYLAAGGVQGLRPLRYEKRVARNRVLTLALVFLAIMLGIFLLYWRHR